MTTFTISTTSHGSIGRFATVEDAQAAMYYLPFLVRLNATVIEERSAA